MKHVVRKTPPDEAPDQSPLTRAARVRAEALYRTHAQPLRALLTRILGSESDALDILHDAFVRLCRPGGLDAAENPPALLRTIAHRLALNALRSRRVRRADFAVDIGSIDIPNAETSAEQRLIFKGDLAMLREEIVCLPPQCRQVVELRAVHELSYAEMSKALGISISTAEKHMANAKRRLRNALNRDLASA